MTRPNAPFKKTLFPSAAMRIERRSDGCILINPELPLAGYLSNLPKVLDQRAARHPQKTYLAERCNGKNSPWTRASYGEINTRSQAFAAWLLSRGIDRHRSVLILSGNSIAHAVIKYGAMAARIPACPVSVNYALMGGDYGRLKHVIQLVKPAVVFAEQTALYKKALETTPARSLASSAAATRSQRQTCSRPRSLRLSPSRSKPSNRTSPLFICSPQAARVCRRP
jgi:feruloyl-CoA synthase